MKSYIPRIQRGNASFAANVLGARGALLSVLVHFFEHGRWGSPVQRGGERHWNRNCQGCVTRGRPRRCDRQTLSEDCTRLPDVVQENIAFAKDGRRQRGAG